MGIIRAEFVTKFLVERNIVVVSGLAEGIDTTAHTTAMVNGGKTIAVIGTPLNISFPASNKRLQDIIGREHLLISQFKENTAVSPKKFQSETERWL